MDLINMGMRLRSLYQRDRDWSDTYISQVVKLLVSLGHHLVRIDVASLEKDNKQATDFEVRIKGGDIAVRLRRPSVKFRDLTIRTHRDSGAKTELAKIKEGYAFCYFYGGLDTTDTISEWIFVDLDKVRETGLLEKERHIQHNHDGTHFIGIPIRELYNAGCLIAYNLKKRRWERVA